MVDNKHYEMDKSLFGSMLNDNQSQQKFATPALDANSTSDIEIIEVKPPTQPQTKVANPETSLHENSYTHKGYSETMQSSGVQLNNPLHHMNSMPYNGSLSPMSLMHTNYQRQQHNNAPSSHAYNPNPMRSASPAKQGDINWTLPMMPNQLDERFYLPKDPDHAPTWEHLLPPPRQNVTRPSLQEPRAYVLSLLSQNSFTVTAVSHHMNSGSFEPNLNGLRIHIKKITKSYGNGQKAVFEKIKNVEGKEEGRWRIPISAYYAFHTFLSSDRMAIVQGIPQNQLKIASLGRSVTERGYPSPEDLIERGVPSVLSKALAPYQRGGVDFALMKHGRVLIADDMGLGKTVQSIASMACYMSEWPLFILTPSSARYHWMNELLQWLGKRKSVGLESSNDAKNEEIPEQDVNPTGRLMQKLVDKKRKAMEELKNKRFDKTPRQNLDHGHEDDDDDKHEALTESQINVINKSKDAMFPNKDTRVVICSYGLATNLIQTGAIYAGLFRCIIVDESHMLKSSKSKRTIAMLPILKAATRVIMLSGTPAFSKPFELYPQLSGLLEHMWISEDDYIKKYCQGTGNDSGNEKDAQDMMNPNLAELHTMLKSTVMIRRTKAEVLKHLPGKVRESTMVKVRDMELKEEIVESMRILRQCNGILGRLSRLHHSTQKPEPITDTTTKIDACPTQGAERADIIQPTNDEEKSSRKAILGHIFKITGTAKVPVIVEMLDRFLSDPASGKVCIFAHHMNVIHSLIQHAEHVGHKFMSITGATLPRVRQENISRFQTDPLVRVAILGITAAGVGVTLTAASTIWFAELFWTPAILIQAEDRCHRIGQQAKVRCLYVIAEGTLDEILWLLVKKKFRDLGEFVEGKEKLNIVVHRQYKDEWSAINQICDTRDKEELSESGADDLEKLDNVDLMEHDLEEMACEEQNRVNINAEDDDDMENEDLTSSRQSRTTSISCTTHTTESTDIARTERNSCAPSIVEDTSVGKADVNTNTEANAVICLSDDEGEHEMNGSGSIDIFHIIQIHRNNPNEIAKTIKNGIPPSVLFPAARLYTISFNGSSYGLALANFSGRVIVQSEPRRGIDVSAGSIIVAVNNYVIPLHAKFPEVMKLLKSVIRTPPVAITFAEEHEFQSFWIEVLNPGLHKLKEQIRIKNAARAKSALTENSQKLVSETNSSQVTGSKHTSNVIDLIDDD